MIVFALTYQYQIHSYNSFGRDNRMVKLLFFFKVLFIMKCGLLCSVQSECHLLIYNYMHVNFCKQLLSYGGDYIDSVGTYLCCYNGVTMDYFSTRRQLYKLKFTTMWWPVFFSCLYYYTYFSIQMTIIYILFWIIFFCCLSHRQNWGYSFVSTITILSA